MEFFVYFVSIWISWAFLTGLFAKVRRNRSGFGWFLLSLVIGPLFAFIIVAILREKEASNRIYVTE